jgi:hypothetical protein
MLAWPVRPRRGMLAADALQVAVLEPPSAPPERVQRGHYRPAGNDGPTTRAASRTLPSGRAARRLALKKRQSLTQPVPLSRTNLWPGRRNGAFSRTKKHLLVQPKTADAHHTASQCITMHRAGAYGISQATGFFAQELEGPASSHDRSRNRGCHCRQRSEPEAEDRPLVATSASAAICSSSGSPGNRPSLVIAVPTRDPARCRSA